MQIVGLIVAMRLLRQTPRIHRIERKFSSNNHHIPLPGTLFCTHRNCLLSTQWRKKKDINSPWLLHTWNHWLAKEHYFHEFYRWNRQSCKLLSCRIPRTIISFVSFERFNFEIHNLWRQIAKEQFQAVPQ